MNRANYRLIAEAIREFRQEWPRDSDSTEAINGLTEALATAFAKDNPYFDRGRFLKAAGAA